MYQRVLVPLDGSDLAQQALPYGEMIAKAFGARLDLVRVAPALADVMQEVARYSVNRWPAHKEWEQALARSHNEVATYLKQVAAGLKSNGADTGVAQDGADSTCPCCIPSASRALA